MRLTFDEVLKEYGPLLGRVAASYEANNDLREELVQEICLAVWQALSKFRGNSSLKTYVLRIAHNRAVNHVSYHAKQLDKHSYCEVESPSPCPSLSTESSLSQQQHIERLLTAVRQLPLQPRQIMTMSMEGLSYQEISEVCGLTSSNVGVILNRAKKQIMESMTRE